VSDIFGTLAYFSFLVRYIHFPQGQKPAADQTSSATNLEEIMSKLHSSVKVGPYEFSHRVVLAPLTRMRAEEGAKPGRPVPAGWQQQAHRYLRRFVRKPCPLPD
jgi:hypothetical protein